MYVRFKSENLKGRGYLVELCKDGRIALMYRKYGVRKCTEYIWLRIMFNGGLS
jgi:hypothetical protein